MKPHDRKTRARSNAAAGRDGHRDGHSDSRARALWVLPFAVLALGYLFWPEGDPPSAVPVVEAGQLSKVDAAASQRSESKVSERGELASARVDPSPALAGESDDAGVPTLLARPPEEPEKLSVRVLATYPHDTTAYTQGLLWHDGHLYESTGLKGQSTLRQVVPETGRIVRQIELDDTFFGEGLARVDDELVQITWHGERALRYDLTSLDPKGEWTYSGAGWGLCDDGQFLYMTDGSATLTVRSREDFSVTDTRTITLRGRPQPAVNELECVDGEIFGNVYGSEMIVRIDPLTGRINGLVDASGLLSPEERAGIDVFNGIAYHPDDGVFYLTGKLWPKLFEVVFTKPD